MNRRQFLGAVAAPAVLRGAAEQPNILFAIADDQSWLHTGAMGDRVVKTPAFDRVASSGVLFRQAFSTCPGCAPSRASILTGRPIWQLEEAGTHASLFPRKLSVFPALLGAAGYHVGLTAKGAGPCNWKDAGWPHNPAGRSYDERKLADPPEGINRIDYAANFTDFLSRRKKGQPFCFWYGGTEPHRTYKKGSGLASGKKLEDVVVPPFLPDTPEVRSDILDYYTEIEHFDRHLGRMLDSLVKQGELAHTLVVVAADNGMSFPRSKATLYEYGIHLPLAAAWPAQFKGGRTSDDVVSYVDLAPTFLEAAGLSAPKETVGRSLLALLRSGKSGRIDASRSKILAGRERHSHARFDNLGYPCRVIRSDRYHYIWNMKPDLWPAGDPPVYADIDNGPTKELMLERREDPKVKPLFELAFGKRPAEELYDIRTDPGCLNNLAGDPARAAAKKKLRAELERDLTAQGDPRMLGYGDVWDSYPRYSQMRPQLGGFSTQGAYNPKYQKKR